jgi:GntR family transcriptional regulator
MSIRVNEGPLPRYYQLKEILREQIRDGLWGPGTPIPSERELCAQYGLSRMTARQAVVDLVRDGLLYRVQGKGTFVARPRMTQQLRVLTGFSQDMTGRGRRPGAQVLDQRMIPAETEVAHRLRVPVGRAIFYLRRLRLADGEPLALETAHLNFLGCDALLTADLASASLYLLLRERFGLILAEADQEIEAGLATPADARLLQISPGSAVLRMRRVTFASGGQVIEYAESVYRGDKYTFYTRLAPPALAGQEAEAR